jgi:uncharacterized protein
LLSLWSVSAAYTAIGFVDERTLDIGARGVDLNQRTDNRRPSTYLIGQTEVARARLATIGVNMIIQDMTREMCIDLLKRTHIGHLGCTQGSQPYVIPMSFAYHQEFLYSFTTIGQKIGWMRGNPLVCVEVDEIVSRHEWQTVVMFGRYQELPDTPDTPEFGGLRLVAHDLLAKTALWWEPGYVKAIHHGEERRLEPIYFRISIRKISGHQGVPGG